MKIEPARSLRGSVTVPGDKSISHRAIMLGAISEGDTRIEGFLRSADCMATIDCMRRLGVRIDVIDRNDYSPEDTGSVVIVRGNGLRGLREPRHTLDAMNSGTTVRLLSGILAGQPFTTQITGDRSLKKRPMKRIMQPLSEMGCRISSQTGTDTLPLTITGGELHGIQYRSAVASAQVKSCVLLAGLYAQEPTYFIEPALSRNHTELMLSAFGANLKTKNDREGRPGVLIYPGTILRGQSLTVPGDISSAAYFIAAGLLVPHSEITLYNVGINETRDGILRVVRAMGGSLRAVNVRMEGREPVADLIVRSSPLTGTIIGGSLIPTLIDELPVIAVMAACAEGDTVIRDAGELRVKESDRLKAIVENLTALGVTVHETETGMVIEGKGGKARKRPGRMGIFKGGVIDPLGDHRLAMAFSVAGLIADDPITITDTECVGISYPDFYEDLTALTVNM